MSDFFSGKVALITGAARGQGRAHAVRLASRGVNIIAVDICRDIPTMDYPNATRADLDETRDLVEAEGAKIVTGVADVADQAALKAVLDDGLAHFGRLDIAIANAGIVRYGEDEDPIATWNDIINTNLTGVWNTCFLARQPMIDGGRGGSIVITSSSAGLKGTGTHKTGAQAYTASKRGIVGLMQVLALDLAPHNIRVNTIHPTGVASGMTMNDALAKMVESGSPEIMAMQNALPVQILQPEDIADAVEWLVSDKAQYVTGITLPVDAGFTVR
ncbi:3-ketoacyl-ACP reductase [Mycolicibacterium anyangense]|jgi:SDR family mycofactocin-dependent oxidoreductase|uniref:3-ketoacyl-ACP reductase n=1 Tax=Mycolicibacterium anyangense TaxID=1431246 RepID=A0A6N4WHW1_9MYCO|nr:mycofactocin-coupled SDR family oxidoreductase [Mycolicibacterium anyangense]BBZ78791.1 3-ketoacyl-ACP reductase [Mycolicibacterium anyangense]